MATATGIGAMGYGATTINQAKAIRQLYQLVTVASFTRHRTARVSLYDAKSRHPGRVLRKVVQF
jgi:hypothetical protein